MKKSVISITIIFLFLITSCTPTAELSPTPPVEPFIPEGIPGEVVYVPFPVNITLYGNLTDWNEIPAYFVDSGPMPSNNPQENGSFTFSVAADKDYFYITMQMPDENIVTGKHGAEFWNEDSMEFYINASGDLSSRSYKTNIFQININASDMNNTDPDQLSITGVFSSGIPVSGFVFPVDGGWGFEVAVALEGILEPEHGLEIGFQTQINGASQQDRDVKLIWSKADTDDNSWQYPNLFGRAIFFELGRSDIPQPSIIPTVPPEISTPSAVIIPSMISVNQIGYFSVGTKIALLATPATNSLDWRLVNQEGEIVTSGKTIIKGDDPTSGDHLHIIDFSMFEIPGDAYKIVIDDLESAPFQVTKDIYTQLEIDSLHYFYHNRSGIPIDPQFVGDSWQRPAGHISDNNVTCYKGTDADGNFWPGCDYTLDVVGGWYDAGDFGKYVVNGGISVWTLLNLYELFPDAFSDGSLSIPEQTNGVSDLLDEARWEMEFLLSMQVPDGQELAGMVHHKIHDASWAPIPMVPPTEVDNDNEHRFENFGRYLFPPSTAATLNLTATAAQAARIWKNIDTDFSVKCLQAAETAWNAALAHPAMYYGNIPGQGGGNYDDHDVSDEFFWAASELFITTGNEKYRDYLLNSDRFGSVEQFEWGRTATLGTFSLLTNDNLLPNEKIEILQDRLLNFAEEMISILQKDGYSVLIKGVYPWGSNGQILNNMMLIGLTYKITGDQKYLDSVIQSMDYLLGRNSINQSYVSGYGTYSMQHPHHRFWANDLANGFPPPPAGALSGGPNANPDDPAAQNANLKNKPESKRYIDDIGSYTTNEVTINWNAPLVWVSVFLDKNMD